MKKRNLWLIKSVIGVVFISAVILLWKHVITREQVADAVEYIQSFGVWAVIVYFFIYINPKRVYLWHNGVGR